MFVHETTFALFCYIVFKQPSKITYEVNDPHRGWRKPDAYVASSSVIVINKQHWDEINEWQKRELIYHELGHVILNLGHNDKTSIMNPFAGKKMYHVKPDGSNWNALVHEMKKRYQSHHEKTQ